MFEVISPPKETEKEAIFKASKEIVDAAKRLGGDIDIEGFIFAWLTNLRVAVERDDSTKEIVGVVMFVAGKRWINAREDATVLRANNPSDGLIDFVKSLCKAIGANSLFIEESLPIRTTAEYQVYGVREYFLQ